MSRLTRARATRAILGIAVPICLLALAALTDRILHHAHPSAPRPSRLTAPTTGDDAPESVAHVRAWIQAFCPGPEGVDDCRPSALLDEFASDLPALRANGEKLEARWITDLAAGDHVAAYGLALIGSRRSLPVLRARLLAERNFYGWETSTPDDPDVLYSDEQFPRQRAMIQAIEWIEGRPLRAALTLTPDDRRQLKREAAGCDGAAAASWLLHKLDGAPLPNAAANRKRRVQCDGPGLRDGCDGE